MTSASLVLAYDDSPAAQRALALVAGYGGPRAALDPVVVTAQPRPLTLWPSSGLDAAVLGAALEAQGQAILAPAVARLRAAGWAPREQMSADPPVEAIVSAASAHAESLIVMGTRGHGVLGGYALGSVAVRVLQRTHAPVVLVQPETRLPDGWGARTLRVLLPTDGTAHALRAVTALLAWRRWLGPLHVDLVHVEEPLTVAEALLPPHRDVLARWSSEAAVATTRQAAEALVAAGIPHTVHQLAGDPAQRIADLAAEARSEWVMLGTRGRGALHHAFVGSVALKVAHACSVPVTLVA